jgi:hypothetical protein
MPGAVGTAPAPAGNAPAGNAPAGTKTAAIVKTIDPAVGNTRTFGIALILTHNQKQN